jgi:hypothetical protein
LNREGIKPLPNLERMIMAQHTLKKVTPLHGRDWWIKWAASVLILLGILCSSNNIYPINLYFHTFGMIGWFIVGMMWNDRALVVINTAGLSLMINGLLRYYMDTGGAY